jgi:hypothetical protein
LAGIINLNRESEMKKMLFAAVLVAAGFAYCLDLKFTAKTGDADFDIRLNKVNDDAKLDLKLFTKELSLEYKVEEKTINENMIKLKMEPAEVFLVLETAKLTKKEPVEIFNIYKTDKKQGWGVMLKKAGIDMKMREFKAIQKKAHYKSEKTKRDQLQKEEKASMKKHDGKMKDAEPVVPVEKKGELKIEKSAVGGEKKSK